MRYIRKRRLFGNDVATHEPRLFEPVVFLGFPDLDDDGTFFRIVERSPAARFEQASCLYKHKYISRKQLLELFR